MAKQKIQALNSAESTWVATEIANARKLAEKTCALPANEELTPGVLDAAFMAARAAGGATADANAIINAVGMAFGQCLVDRLGFQWVAVFDDHGAEIAVVALPGQADLLIFPPNLVAKRWQSGATDFLVPIYEDVAANLRRLKAQWSGRAGE